MIRCLQTLKLPASEGVFETFPLRNGQLEFFTEHWKRLKASCHALRYPFLLDPAELEQHILDLSRKEPSDEKIVRLIALKKEMPILIVQFLPLPKPLHSVELIPATQSPHPLAQHKITLRKSYENLRKNALAEKKFDVLLISPENEVLETTRTNIFIVAKGKLYTPPADGRILRGIIRDQVIERAKILKMPLEEKIITVNELSKADEVFITNSLRGVLPVTGITGLWSQSHPPKLTSLLTGTLPVNNSR